LKERRVRFYKEGSIKMTQHSTTTALAPVAGIDVSKDKLDVALESGRSLKRRGNDEQGFADLIDELTALGVVRIGLEATGGYERKLIAALRQEGFAVIVLQPLQVRAYAVYRLHHAKSDKLDARIIAQCAADWKAVREPADPRLEGLAAHLTAVEQIGEDIARSRIRLEFAACQEAQAHHKALIAWLKARRRDELKHLEAKLRAHADLATKLDLITGIPGIGRLTALCLVIRMPELGQVSREKAASLLGVAPMIRQSGKFKGEAHVQGGRMRPRTALFACAQAAILHNDQLKAFYKRLRAKGKHHAVAIMACARKLAIYVNTVLIRGTPWQNQPPIRAAA
jgi:transposase